MLLEDKLWTSCEMTAYGGASDLSTADQDILDFLRALRRLHALDPVAELRLDDSGLLMIEFADHRKFGIKFEERRENSPVIYRLNNSDSFERKRIVIEGISPCLTTVAALWEHSRCASIFAVPR